MMPAFRDHTPKRRSITRVVNKYGDHKPDLKIDFVSRCGYCNSHDEWKRTYYEVDHFIPENILTIKSLTDYSNLVYACRSCNNSKRKKWPTKDQNVPNRNNEGFIDPCEDTYLTQFTRTDTGEIMYVTDLGKWIYYALQLHKPQHQIIYILEQLEPLVQEIKKLSEDEKIKPEVRDYIFKTYDRYTDYINQWKGL